MPRINYDFICNVMNSMNSTSAPASCTSAIFAGVCKKLASYYADLYFVRWSNARKDYRCSKEERDSMRDKFYEWQDAARAWEWRYAELTSTLRALGVVERRRLRKNHRTFERLLFKHWDSTTGCWTFGNYTFG